jgi:effector-binding domain-containing protein
MRVLQVSRETTIPGMAKTFGQAYLLISAYMARKNVACEFAPFGRYRDLDWEKLHNTNPLVMFLTLPFKKWKIDIGYPVAYEVAGEGEIESTQLQAGKYLECTHKGSYQTICKTYQEIYAYAKQENLRLGTVVIESYLNDPKETKPEDLETKISAMLA